MISFVTSIGAWLIGNALGRTILLWGLGALTVGLVILAIFKKGQNHEKALEAARDLKHLQERIRTNDEVRRMSPSDRRERLREWAR